MDTPEDAARACAWMEGAEPDDVDVCPNCRAVESMASGRCHDCHHGTCRECLSEPVLVNWDQICDELCGGKDQCSVCDRTIPLDSTLPLCQSCERTARSPNCGPAREHTHRSTP